MTHRSILAALFVLSIPACLPAQQPAAFTELAPGTLLFPTPAGNLVATITAQGVFLVGPLSAASTGPIQAVLSRRTQSPIRYVLATPRPLAQVEGDGGWGRLGAMVATHESSWGRLSDSARLAASHTDAPQAAFSEVLKFDLDGHGMHAVHQHPGYSNADFLVHFESDGVLYLGEILPGDGYPIIDSVQGGTLNGMIDALAPWTNGDDKFVPARGPALAAADVLAFRDMLVAMRTRVRTMVQGGRTADQVVAAHPSAEFDARFGHGRVSPETFVREVYRAVSGR